MANPFENVSYGAPVQQRPTQPLFPAEATPAENPTAAAGQSIIEQLLARIKGGEDPATTGAADIGQVAGSLANDERLNRMSKGAFTQNYDRTMLDGRMQQLPTFGSAPRPASAAQMESGGTLEDMLKQRLASGGSYLPQPLESYAQPGKVENISRYGGTIASGLGVINDLMNSRGQGGQPGVSPAQPGGSNIYKKIGGGVMSGLRKMVGK